jgi:hypothetical protein
MVVTGTWLLLFHIIYIYWDFHHPNSRFVIIFAEGWRKTTKPAGDKRDWIEVMAMAAVVL